MSARCILGCPPKTRAKHVHRFPNPIKYPNQHEAWLKVVPEHKKENFEYQKRRICDKHFLKKDKYFKGLLNKNAIPTLCLPGQPNTHNNCNCDWKFAGADSPVNANIVEVIRNTVEDEHNYTTTITEHRKPIRSKPISLLEKEHDYHSKPQEVDKTIDYVHESGNATSTCIKLLDRYDDFGKIGEPTVIEDALNITDTYTLEETLNNVSDKPQPVLSDADVVKVEIEGTIPQNKTVQNRKTKKKYFSSTTKESNFKVHMTFIENTSEQNNSKTSTISNSNKQSNVTGQVSLVSDAAVTENISSAKSIQNTKTLHKIQNNVVYSVLKSGRNVFLSNCINNANISKLLQENTETSTMPKICMTDSDELCISDNDFPNNAIDRRTVVPQPVVSNADIADLETEKSNIVEINSDRLCISNDLHSNVTGQVQQNTSNAKSIQNTFLTKTFHEIQNNGPCKQSVTSAHFATLKSGCNVLSTNSIRNANISKFLHENTETSTISNICLAETNSDELYISDNEFKNNAIGRRTVVPQPVLSNADIADLEAENTSIANSNTLIPVRIYNEENSTSGSRPGSPKRAKLDISELDEYRIVGSTTIVTGLFASDEIQPLEDPLAIHSPIKGDMGINDCVGLIEDSMGSVEDSMGTVEDNMSIDKDSSHPVDSIKINNKDSMAHFDDKEYELNDSIYINNEDELEIAYALKFIFKQGKTAKQAFEEIMTTYGPGKMSLKEAECWYRELEIGNDVMRIISSGGPVYK